MGTTNRVEVLDAALVRPGRCDIKACFDYIQQDTFEEYVSLFFGKQIFEDAKRQCCPPAKFPDKVGLSQVQGHCMMFKDAILQVLQTYDYSLRSDLTFPKGQYDEQKRRDSKAIFHVQLGEIPFRPTSAGA